jgi:membrane protein required for beta-lactamase induction
VTEGGGEFVEEGARRNVADQVAELLIGSVSSGSRDIVALRIRSVLEAERRNEPRALRAAAVELAVAAGAWAAVLDVRLQDEAPPRRLPR